MSTKKDEKSTDKKVMAAMDEMKAVVAAVSEGSVADVVAAAKKFRDETGASVASLRDARGRTPLHLAAQRGDADILIALVKECAVPVDAEDKDGNTPLMAAADYAKPDAVRTLIELGADRAKAKSDGVTAMHRAAASAFAEGAVTSANSINAAACVETLAKDAKDDRFVDAKCASGNTPFLLACSRGAEANIVRLKALGANASATNDAGVGAASLATASGVPGALRAALAAGAPTHLRPVGGMTALHVAASHPHCADASDELVRALLDAGADSDAVDGERMKPIHAAAAVGRVGVVETLLERTTRDDGVAEGDWNASGVQKIVQEKLRAMGIGTTRGGTGGGTGDGDDAEKRKHWAGAEGGPDDEPPYVAKGASDADAAAAKKRAGDEAFVKGADADAIAAYDASLAADDSNAKVWANRAAAKLRQGSHASARRDAKIAREIEPTYVKAWYREGLALTELGDFEGAAMAFFEGMQIDGDNKELKRGFDAAIARGRKAHLAGGGGK